MLSAAKTFALLDTMRQPLPRAGVLLMPSARRMERVSRQRNYDEPPPLTHAYLIGCFEHLVDSRRRRTFRLIVTRRGGRGAG